MFDPADPAGEHVLYVWDNVAVNLAMLLGWLVLFRLALRFEGEDEAAYLEFARQQPVPLGLYRIEPDENGELRARAIFCEPS